MMIENPFFHRGVIRDPAYFANRKSEVRRALGMLSKGQSVSVVGPRKIGKTSFLFYISQPEVMQQHGLDPTRHLFVYIDCEALGNLERNALYTLILKEIIEQANRQDYKVEVPDLPDSHISFERSLGSILKLKVRLVLLLDEFEGLGKNPKLGGDFFSGLRALVTHFDMAYVTVSQRSLSTLPFTKESSAFFNIFSLLEIGLFSETESQELIENYMRKIETTLDRQVIDLILALGGGHPYFLQVTGYWALELQYTEGYKDPQVLKTSVFCQIESHFESYWGHLEPEERNVLTALPMIQDKPVHRDELKSLRNLCLIVKENGGYKYFSPLFREFVRRQAVPGVLQAGQFVLSTVHQIVLLREEPLALSAKQFSLLKYLMEHQGRAVSNEELDREVMTSPEDRQMYEYLGDERLKSAIKELRRALGDDAECIVNVRGVGYMLQVRIEE